MITENAFKDLTNTNKVLDTNLFINTFFSKQFSFIRILKTKLGGNMYVDAAVLDELLIYIDRTELFELFNDGILILHDPEEKYPQVHDSNKICLDNSQKTVYRTEYKNIRTEFNKIEAQKAKQNPHYRKKKNEGESASLALARVLHLPIIYTDDTSVPKVISDLDLQVLIQPSSEDENSQYIQTYELLDLCEVLITNGLVPKSALNRMYKHATNNDAKKDEKRKRFRAIEEPTKSHT